jgi:hypothetical protein
LWLTVAVLGVLTASGLVGLRPSLPILILVVGACGLALLLQRPGLALFVMAALSFTLPLEIGTGSEVSLTPPVFLITLAAGVWLLNGLRERRLRLPASRTILPLLLFVGSGLLSLGAGIIYWDPFVPRAGGLLLVQLAQWAIFALSAAVFLLAGDLGQDTHWLQIATWTFLILAGVVVLENYVPWLHRALGWYNPWRAKSGMLFAWLGALGTGQLVFNRRLSPLVRLFLLLLLLGTGYVAWFQEREWVSAWGPFSAATLMVIWLRVWRHSRTLAVVAAGVLIGLAVLLFPIVFVHAGGEQELEVSWGGRLALYQAVLDLVEPHPVLGLGPAAYRHYAYTRPLSMGAGRAFYVRPWVSSHNNYIDIYAQMGLVGLGLFLWFLVELGVLGWRLAPRFSQGDFADGYVQGALAGLTGSVVAMLLVDWFLPYVYNVGFPGFRTSALAWMFLGGLLALEQITARDGSGESAPALPK